MKKSFNNFRAVKLMQNFEECKKSLGDLIKVIYIVTKYNSLRTQFMTLEKRFEIFKFFSLAIFNNVYEFIISKDERKILQYQNNSNKIIKALCESIIFKIGLNNLENNQKMVFSNISKVTFFHDLNKLLNKNNSEFC